MDTGFKDKKHMIHIFENDELYALSFSMYINS